jgi:hypothetical protein
MYVALRGIIRTFSWHNSLAFVQEKAPNILGPYFVPVRRSEFLDESIVSRDNRSVFY